jgi:hypothetical protein
MLSELVVRPGTPPPLHAVAAELEARGGAQLVVHQTTFARAYVYCGEWVADCPAGCNNTEFITSKDPRRRGVAGVRGAPHTAFRCSYCRYVSESIHWPPDAEQILDVLDERPLPHTRNWYPSGHVTAVRCGIPDGQSVQDLIAENIAHGVA